MDETEASEHDMYIAQLKEVFDSCDQTGSGKLNRPELFLLCDRLQLEDQSAFLVNGLLQDKEEVDFEEFKDSFVSILCQTSVDEPLSESEDEVDEEEGSGAESEDQGEGKEGEKSQAEDAEETSVKREVSPKFVKGSKHYGRKSLPFKSDDFDCLADDEDDTDVRSSTRSLKHSLTAESVTDTEEDGSESHKKRRRRTSDGSVSDGDEMFEAEGQLNLMMADSENLTTEEEYLRGIWNNLGVGKNGYISIKELEQVCRHIGMEEMSPSELQQLFDKLDADGDGRVSFQEFLAELFQHNTPANQHPSASTPGTPRSIGPTPTRSLSAQKKLKYPAASGSEERTTPSVVQGTGVSGLFSVLDPEKTGFAKPDAIIDLWEKYNVTNGADILLALGFELNTKVNLSELSVLLEQELLGADEQNILLQAATASYQQEMRNVKSSLEQAGWAIEKLKLDLSEANTRNSMLAKEVDERHASMEKSSESKLLSVEKKYQDQIKSLQAELDKERENYNSVAAKQKQSLDSEMEELRLEEAKLRDQLLEALKEMERVTGELELTSERLEESEKLNQRYQRELESVEGLHHKLAEYESKGIMSPDEQKFTREKMLRIELENKELKDQNDELTAELEQVKLQGTTPRKSLEPSSPERGTHPPAREGSVMSNYVRPVVVKRALNSPYDYSDDDTKSPRNSQVLGEHDDEIRLRLFKKGLRQSAGVGGSFDKDTIERLKREIEELKENFERERKDIEQQYKLEIADVEAKHDEEKGEILRNIKKEKAKIMEDFERLQQEALAELGKELQTKFVHEKEDLIQKHESEKNLREQKYAEEKQKLTERIAVEYEEDIEVQLVEMKNKYDQEKFQLEEALTELEPYVKDLENKNSDLQAKLEKQKDEMEKKLKQEKSEMKNLEAKNSDLEQKLEKQKSEMDKKLKEQKSEMEELFSRHMQSIGDVEKKKSDIELKYKKQINELELANRQERMELESEIERLQQDVKEVKKQKSSLELEMKQQREELELSYRQEQQEIKELYEEKIREMTESHRHFETNLLQEGVAGLHGKLKEDFYKLLNEMKSNQADEIREAMKLEFSETEKALQTEFEARKSELSHVFEREREELKEKYEEQIQLLQQQLDQLQEKLEEERESLAQRFEGDREAIEEQLAQQIREELEEEICQQIEDIKEAFDDEKREYESQTNLLKQEVEELQRALEAEDKNRKKLDEVMRANNKLQQEKRTAEKGQVELREALESTKKALESRIDELLNEKEGVITAVRAEMVQSSKQNGSDKSNYDALVMEKTALESRVSSLSEEVVDLQFKADSAEKLQETVEKLTEEQQRLREKVSELEVRLKNSQSAIPQHAQQVIDQLTKEKAEMEERLMDTEQKLNELEETGQKFLHLQLDFEQLAFDHSALEETLLETQEKLVDTQQTLDQSEKELKDSLKYKEKCRQLQQSLDKTEKELKESFRYKDKCRHLQRKYDEACKERDKAVSFAKSVKEQLNHASSSQKEEHEDRGRLAAVLEEKKQLEIQLQKINDKLLEATTNFAVSQSQHVKELQQWKEQTTNMVDLQKYTRLQIELVDSQRSVRDLQEAISNKEEMSAKKFKDSIEKHQQEMKELEDIKESLGRQLKTLQEVLDNQIEKYKEQYEAGEKRNALVVDLYKENADLMQALYHVEEQKKDAISKCYKLEDQCNNLRRMLKKIARVAIT